MSARTDHMVELDRDEDQWWIAVCTCGRWESPPVPDAGTASDTHTDHVLAVLFPLTGGAS